MAQELCRCWDWRNARGRLKDFAARSFLLNHTYLDDGTSRADSFVYRVVVTVRDEYGDTSATPVFLVEVDNVLPTNLNLQLDRSSIVEGESVTLTGSFTDPGLLDSHLVYINWRRDAA